MPRLVCFIYTQTNGLHNSNEFVSKKNMFEFARPVSLHYIIGYKQGDDFIETKKEKFIFKPDCLFISPESEKIHGISLEKAEKKGTHPGEIMNKLKLDLKNVSVIVSHNLPFHIKALQVECFRNCVNIDFSNHILIDTMYFNHNHSKKLKELSEIILKKDYSNKKSSYNLTLIKKCFLKLYQNYEKNILNS
jgi:DNA polymerase III epsilon subunit-like protein